MCALSESNRLAWQGVPQLHDQGRLRQRRFRDVFRIRPAMHLDGMLAEPVRLGAWHGCLQCVNAHVCQSILSMQSPGRVLSLSAIPVFCGYHVAPASFRQKLSLRSQVTKRHAVKSGRCGERRPDEIWTVLYSKALGVCRSIYRVPDKGHICADDIVYILMYVLCVSRRCM